MRKLLAFVTVTVALGIAPVAVGSTSATAGLNIQPQATLWAFSPGFNGVFVTVGYQCAVGPGTVTVKVAQTAAQSGNGTATTATGSSSLNCDGTPRTVTLSLLGTAPGFNDGKAAATASLVATSGSVTDARTITISG